MESVLTSESTVGQYCLEAGLRNEACPTADQHQQALDEQALNLVNQQHQDWTSEQKQRHVHETKLRALSEAHAEHPNSPLRSEWEKRYCEGLAAHTAEYGELTTSGFTLDQELSGAPPAPSC
jgi:hypothetical protein